MMYTSNQSGGARCHHRILGMQHSWTHEWKQCCTLWLCWRQFSRSENVTINRNWKELVTHFLSGLKRSFHMSAGSWVHLFSVQKLFQSYNNKTEKYININLFSFISFFGSNSSWCNLRISSICLQWPWSQADKPEATTRSDHTETDRKASGRHFRQMVPPLSAEHGS